MLKKIKNIFIKSLSLISICGICFGVGFLIGSCKTTEKPMYIKYQYIPYPKYTGVLMDVSTDLNTIPRITLMNQCLILQSYIKKLIRRSDLIDYLYFDVNSSHKRYEEFRQYNLGDIEGLKNAYKDYAAPLDNTNDR